MEVTDLLKVCVPSEFERPNLSGLVHERVLGLEALQKHSKLIVLGKPGIGKTTFLKHIALQCLSGSVESNKVPVLIVLKDFAEMPAQPSLLEYITYQFASYGIADTAIATQLLSYGRVLILLDGLDEVQEKDCYRVVQEVRSFSAQFHANHFILTCRIATHEYTFEEFTEVEIADFDFDQIKNFANNWFTAKDASKSEVFLEKLQEKPAFRELANNPLFLTLLCLVFESNADFPTNRTQLYKEGLNLLLKKWDAKRNIERKQVYKNLSVQHKEDLLSQIALKTFERGEYFFTQQQLEQYIGEYICSLPSANTAVKPLELDSEEILKAIEAQHGLLVERARGIYSFSHLTFHEYFTARAIASECDGPSDRLQDLVDKVADKRWHEVFLFSVSMLRNADYLLRVMKHHIDQIVAADDHVQSFLGWVSQKARNVPSPYKGVIVRGFYFDLEQSRVLDELNSNLNLSRSLEPALSRNLNGELSLDLTLDRTLTFNRVVKIAGDRTMIFHRVLERAINRAHVVAPKLEHELQQLKRQVPDINHEQNFEQWWQVHGEAWTEQLRLVIIAHRNFGYNWEFSQQQKETLKHYYDASQLLVDCLNSSCYVTSAIRQEILDTLLLPINELQALSSWYDFRQRQVS